MKNWRPEQRLGIVALVIIIADQISKFLVMRFLGFREEYVVIAGFFRLVHWGNTGAAWSVFKDNNDLLALVSAVALVVLFLSRRHFFIEASVGQLALGLLCGGIVGNLIDRLLQTRKHVIDFLYFYLERRGGGEIGFPAFNVADSAICIGVALIFLLSWNKDRAQAPLQAAGQTGE
jgi:signal peptidase II